MYVVMRSVDIMHAICLCVLLWKRAESWRVFEHRDRGSHSFGEELTGSRYEGYHTLKKLIVCFVGPNNDQHHFEVYLRHMVQYYNLWLYYEYGPTLACTLQ